MSLSDAINALHGKTVTISVKRSGTCEAQVRQRQQDGTLGWTLKAIRDSRAQKPERLERVVAAIDPGRGGGETGIIVAGIDGEGDCYVLADCSVKSGDPAACVRRAVAAYEDHGADLLAGVANMAGDYLGALIERVSWLVQYKKVYAVQPLHVRAASVLASYRCQRVHHVQVFRDLEEQMSEWHPRLHGEANRLSALVCAITELESR